MKYHLLSFMIACGLALGVFYTYQAIKPAESGQALASVNGADADVSQSGGQLRALKARLVKDTDSLLEFTGADIREAFDAPELVRTDLPTVIWQYRNEACVLDVFYTASSADVSKAPVAHYEVRSRDAKGRKIVEAQSCVSEMVQGGNLISLLDISAIYKSER